MYIRRPSSAAVKDFITYNEVFLAALRQAREEFANIVAVQEFAITHGPKGTRQGYALVQRTAKDTDYLDILPIVMNYSPSATSKQISGEAKKAIQEQEKAAKAGETVFYFDAFTHEEAFNPPKESVGPEVEGEFVTVKKALLVKMTPPSRTKKLLPAERQRAREEWYKHALAHVAETDLRRHHEGGDVLVSLEGLEGRDGAPQHLFYVADPRETMLIDLNGDEHRVTREQMKSMPSFKPPELKSEGIRQLFNDELSGNPELVIVTGKRFDVGIAFRRDEIPKAIRKLSHLTEEKPDFSPENMDGLTTEDVEEAAAEYRDTLETGLSAGLSDALIGATPADTPEFIEEIFRQAETAPSASA